MDAKLICIKDELFYQMIDTIVQRLSQHTNTPAKKWVNQAEAMTLLNIKSRTTLQKYRDEGRIRFSQPHKTIILYDRDSINEYLEDNAIDTY